jgi:hypothetical protein
MSKKLISLILIATLLPFFADAKDMKMVDPTDNSTAGKPELELSAVAFAHNQFYCVINDKLLMQGDSISVYKVKNITIDHVTLIQDDNIEVLLTIS